MTDGSEEQRFHTVQPLRDLQSNWDVDLAKNLEDYLLKICSGEISGIDDTHLSVNFAEAALLLQGSVQVYSRKVEYLYNLVVHALEFISQKSVNNPQNQTEGTSVQPEESSSGGAEEADNDYWDSDHIPVDPKNLLDDANGHTASQRYFVKPPANLVVLEGDCLDTTGDGGELESFLLATNDLYRDFILLDPCDALAVDIFLQDDIPGKRLTDAFRGSCLNSKSRKSFLSPTKRSGGSAYKSSQRKNQEVNFNGTPFVNHTAECDDINMDPDLPCACDNPANSNHGFDMDDDFSEHINRSDSDDDEDNDPWKPLNPHEPGNLKVKPFKKVKAFRRRELNLTKRIPINAQFPPAKMHGTISSELMEIWEKQQQACERQQESQSPPLYEKLRESLINGGCESLDAFKVENEENAYDSDNPGFEQSDDDMPQMMDENVPLDKEKHNDGASSFDRNDAFEHEDTHPDASLEDLCRSHLDSLLASIAEAEKQTELAARVSTWKQKIEHDMEDQDSRPPFDIHKYGDRILDKLSVKTEKGNVMPFSDVVAGQEKHDIARSFSALLQLVNNGDVDLERNAAKGEHPCYTAVNPFHVRLLKHDIRHEDLQFPSSKKQAKSPRNKKHTKSDGEKAGGREPPSSSGLPLRQIKSKPPVKGGKMNGIKLTPEGKRRRRSQLVEPAN